MNTKRLLKSLLVLTVTMTTVSCVHAGRTIHITDDKLVSETRPLKGFEQIEINGSPTVYYNQADTFSVKVEGNQTGVENILTEVSGDKLIIRNRGKVGVVNIVVSDNEQASVHITSPDLIGVTLNGSGDFISERRVDTDNMQVVLRGSGDVDIKDLICDRCEVELVGSGDIDLDRVDTREASAVLVGSGDIDLKLLRTASTRLSLKGSGDIDAQFSEGCGSVACELRGSGDINLEGQVHQFTKQKSGSGDINTDRLTIR